MTGIGVFLVVVVAAVALVPVIHAVSRRSSLGQAATPAAPASAGVRGCFQQKLTPPIPSGIADRPAVVNGHFSHNWSGFATAGASVTDEGGTWVVPTVVPAQRAEYSSTWVGVDGFGNNNLIQVGTAQDTRAGATTYYAWWEVLPATESRMSIRVSPGDTVSASVSQVCGDEWKIVFSNATDHTSWSGMEVYKGTAGSVEAVEEAPTIDNAPSTLANFGTVDFSRGHVDHHFAGADHGMPGDGVDMISTSGLVIARPTPPTKSGLFSISYVGQA